MANPAEYVSSNVMQKRAVLMIVNEFVKNLKSISGTCMDVGCGPGNITRTDVSVAMIEYAKKAYCDNKRLEFEILDIQTKSLPEKYISKFNHIFSFFTLHWCNEIRTAFENMYCMLQPGGTIFILFPLSHDTFYNPLKNIARDARFAPYFQNLEKRLSPLYDSVFPRENLKNLLESVGFNVQHCSLRELDFSDLLNTDTFLNSIMSICNFIDAMPPERQEEFKVEFLREHKNYIKIKLYDNKQCDKERPILDVHKLLLAVAQKDM
ncbi:PREDICTED: uncharacterized protein LOC105458715 isoform X2 [Wasmannia auropunctata]|uniref:uncharacterized protein LOC105458715 isoform X2 n=1 Tax=Wasmannia auropunctata TaxID=64793 RepID=UPI0005EDBB90|nr:PREDICTED: uncharacterized protein LOC105458715 isoform X2 [Wasmannia auropunctata]